MLKTLAFGSFSCKKSQKPMAKNSKTSTAANKSSGQKLNALEMLMPTASL